MCKTDLGKGAVRLRLVVREVSCAGAYRATTSSVIFGYSNYFLSHVSVYTTSAKRRCSISTFSAHRDIFEYCTL